MIGYCYLVRHKLSGLCYYGARSTNLDPNDDLFKVYFTSSKVVHVLINRDGIDSFEIEIRKIFKDNYIKAFNWEHKVLKKLKAGRNKKMLNGTSGSGLRKLCGGLGNPGWKWVNNGVVEMSWPADRLSIPNQWKLGRIRCPTKGMIWINDGIKNSRINPNIDIPIGWVKGRINLPKSFIGDSESRSYLKNNKHNEVFYEKLGKMNELELEQFMNKKQYSDIKKIGTRTIFRKQHEVK